MMKGASPPTVNMRRIDQGFQQDARRHRIDRVAAPFQDVGAGISRKTALASAGPRGTEAPRVESGVIGRALLECARAHRVRS